MPKNFTSSYDCTSATHCHRITVTMLLCQNIIPSIVDPIQQPKSTFSFVYSPNFDGIKFGECIEKSDKVIHVVVCSKNGIFKQLST